MERRDWMKHAALLGGGLSLTTALRGQPKPAEPSADPGMPRESSHGYINLSINENQFGPSPKVRAAMTAAVPYAFEYPAVPLRRLREAIAEHEGVEPEQVLIGAGSSDLLKAASYYFGLKGGSIVSSDPTFNDLMQWAEPHGVELVKVPWTEDYQTDLKGIRQAMRSDTGLVYVCNPENPVGTVVGARPMADFCREVGERCPVFVDEAYLDFAGEADELTMMPLVREGLPVIVSRTFSKAYGLGGMRVGYAVTTPELAGQIESMYVNGVVSGTSHVSIEGARAAYADREWLAHVRAETAKVRRDFGAFCDSIGQPYIPSHTSFMLLPVEKDSTMLANALFGATQVRISPRVIQGRNYLRISMGNPQQMQRLQMGLRMVLA